MAYVAGNLTQISNANGYGLYRYDTTDLADVVEAAGYLNNGDDNLNLAVGDLIHCFSWTTAVRTGTLSQYKLFAVTNVITDGAVNLAEVGVSTSGAISSGA